MKESPVIIELKGDYNIVNIGGNYGIVPKKDSEDDLIKTLSHIKEKETERKVNLIPMKGAENFIDYENIPKYIEKDFKKIFENLDAKFRSLFTLSIFIDGKYKDNKKEEAEILRNDVRNRYGEPGLKFVNLWSRSYLRSLFKFLSQRLYLPLDINTKISEFIEKSESIFFIYPGTEHKKIAIQINELLKKGQEYIAIHSLGLTSGVVALKIIERVKLPKFSDYKDVQILQKKGEVYDVSRIWYKGDGVKTYLLIKDLIT